MDEFGQCEGERQDDSSSPISDCLTPTVLSEESHSPLSFQIQPSYLAPYSQDYDHYPTLSMPYPKISALSYSPLQYPITSDYGGDHYQSSVEDTTFAEAFSALSSYIPGSYPDTASASTSEMYHNGNLVSSTDEHREFEAPQPAGLYESVKHNNITNEFHEMHNGGFSDFYYPPDSHVNLCSTTDTLSQAESILEIPSHEVTTNDMDTSNMEIEINVGAGPNFQAVSDVFFDNNEDYHNLQSMSSTKQENLWRPY